MSTNPNSKRSTLVAWAAVTFALAGAVACEGGKAGDRCSSNNDCNTSLTCRPVDGRNADYCCGAYGPETAGENIPENCQPLGSGSGSGAGSSAGSGTGSSPPAQDAAPGD